MSDYTLKYTGEEIDDAIGKAKSGKMPNPSALTINGTSYDGSNAVELNVGNYSEYVEILPMTTLGDMALNESSYNMWVLLQKFTLTEGETYIVHYNGVEYSCVAVAYSTPSSDGGTFNYVCLGEMGSYADYEVTGEPFRLMWDKDKGFSTFYVYDGATEVTLSIAPGQIDPKYLPGKLLPNVNSSDVHVCVWNGLTWGPVSLSVLKAMLENVT